MKLPEEVEKEINRHYPSPHISRNAMCEIAEWLMELVCETCGKNELGHHGRCRGRSPIAWATFITRAEYLHRTAKP